MNPNPNATPDPAENVSETPDEDAATAGASPTSCPIYDGTNSSVEADEPVASTTDPIAAAHWNEAIWR